MNIRQLGKLVDYLWARGTDPVNRAHMPVMIWGETGIGKSETVKQRCDTYKDPSGGPAGWIDLRLGTQDVGDLIGLPRIQDVFPDPIALAQKRPSKLFTKEALILHLSETYPDQFGTWSGDEIWDQAEKAIPKRYKGTQRMVYAIPEWFPEPNTRGILFLDELNRGQRDVLQAIFQLLLDRQLHMAKLPKDWIILSAINPEGDDYAGAVFDPAEDRAFLSRFCHVALQPTKEEWLSYAYQSGVDSSITDVVSFNEQLLGKVSAVMLPENIAPSPRTWVLFSRIAKPLIDKVFEDVVSKTNTPTSVDDETVLKEIAKGFIGPAAFDDWWRLAFVDVRPPTAEEVFTRWSISTVKKNPDGSVVMENGQPKMLEPARDRYNRIYQRIKQDSKTEGLSSLHHLLRSTSDQLVFVFDRYEAEIERRMSEQSGQDSTTLRKVVFDVIGREGVYNLIGEERRVADPNNPTGNPIKKLVREGYITDLMNWSMSDELMRVFSTIGMTTKKETKPRCPRLSLFFQSEAMPWSVVQWWTAQTGKTSPAGLSASGSQGLFKALGDLSKKPKPAPDKVGGLDDSDDILSLLLNR